MPEPLFEFDNELGRWKPTKRGRAAVNRRRTFRRSGRPRYEPRGRAFTNPDQMPELNDFARNGGELIGGGPRRGNQRLTPAQLAQMERVGGRRAATAGGAASTRARQDLGRNAQTRTGRGGGTAAGGGGRGNQGSNRGGSVRGALRGAGRAAGRLAARAANAAADRLEDRAARRRRGR